MCLRGDSLFNGTRTGITLRAVSLRGAPCVKGGLRVRDAGQGCSTRVLCMRQSFMVRVKVLECEPRRQSSTPISNPRVNSLRVPLTRVAYPKTSTGTLQPRRAPEKLNANLKFTAHTLEPRPAFCNLDAQSQTLMRNLDANTKLPLKSSHYKRITVGIVNTTLLSNFKLAGEINAYEWLIICAVMACIDSS